MSSIKNKIALLEESYKRMLEDMTSTDWNERSVLENASEVVDKQDVIDSMHEDSDAKIYCLRKL